jgi:peptidoglycan/xylan/chitin deacetylase (PgdA/CDA1 family)
MLDVLDKYEVKCTAVVNSEALARFPDVTEAIKQRKWAIAGHGRTNTQFVYGYSKEQERRYYQEMLAKVKALTGVTMAGMGGAGPQAATEHTLDVLAEEGFLYHTDWFCDDQPFPLRVRSGRLISMPYSVEINDTLVFGAGGEADQFYQMIRRQFDRLYNEGKDTGRVMCISLHPNLIGQPHRIQWLERALAYISQFPDVWHATGDEIAAYYFENVYDAMVKHLGNAWTDGP